MRMVYLSLLSKCAQKKDFVKKGYPPEYLNYYFLSNGSSRLAHQEFKISQQLNHPNLIQVYDLYEEDQEGEKNTYLIMEWVDGTTLDNITKGTLTREQAIQNGLTLIDVLIYALQQGYVHEDLYSENLMFDQKNGLKFIDLNSFSELEETGDDEEDYTTNRHYLNVISIMLVSLLNHGPIQSDELAALRLKIEERLANSPYTAALDQPLCKDSVTVLISYLHDIADCLKKSSFSKS